MKTAYQLGELHSSLNYFQRSSFNGVLVRGIIFILSTMAAICSLQRLGAPTTATTAPGIVISVAWTPPPTSPCFSFDPGLPAVTPLAPLPPAAPRAFVQHELYDADAELMAPPPIAAPPAKTYHRLLHDLVHVINAADQGRETQVRFYAECGIEMTEVDSINQTNQCFEC